jgi:hypothetical protein
MPLIRQDPSRDDHYDLIQHQRLPLLKLIIETARTRLSKEEFLNFLTREHDFYGSPLSAACFIGATTFAAYLLTQPEVCPLFSVSSTGVSAFGKVLYNAAHPDQYTNPKFNRALILKFLDHPDYYPVIESMKASMDIDELATAESMPGGFSAYLHSKVGTYAPIAGTDQHIFEFNPEGLAWLSRALTDHTQRIRSRWSPLRSAWTAAVVRATPTSPVAP